MARLSPPQRVLLADSLRSRLTELQHERTLSLRALSPAESARNTLPEDADDATQRVGMHEVENRIFEMQDDEIDAISSALHRINGIGYGVCIECELAIGFERLQIEPQAVRCLACQTRHEQHTAA